MAFKTMLDLVRLLVFIVSNSAMCACASPDQIPLCKQDCRLSSKVSEAAIVLPCKIDQVDMSFCSGAKSPAEQTKELVKECWNTETSEIMISWHQEDGGQNEFFIHVTKNEIYTDIKKTTFCFRLSTSDPRQGAWLWVLTMTTYCLNLDLNFALVNIHLLRQDVESVWDEFVYKPGAMCPTTPELCDPWASGVDLTYLGTTGTVGVNVTKTKDVLEVILILKEIKCSNNNNNITWVGRMACEDALCSALIQYTPTGIYRLEVIPRCNEECEDRGGCHSLYKEFAVVSTSEGSACSSPPPPVSTPVPTLATVWLVATLVFSSILIAAIVALLTFLFMRWRKNIRRDAREFQEEAVSREALYTEP